MPAPTISALTPAPNRLDPNFATVADAFLNGFPTLRAEINAFANYLNTTALVSYAFSDGTAAQPSLRFASDANTGIFRPSSDNIAFATSGAERLRIASDGKVGIGTSSPTRSLEIETEGTATLALKSNKRSAAGEPVYSLAEIDFLGSDTLSGNASVVPLGRIALRANTMSTVPGGELAFYTNEIGQGQLNYPTERMRITSQGRVGIGTDEPEVPFHLDTPGDSSLRVQSAGATYVAIETDGVSGIGTLKVTNEDTAGHLDIRTGTGSSVAMRVSKDGNVGIGTVNPSGVLEVNTGSSGAFFTRSSGNITGTPTLALVTDSTAVRMGVTGDSMRFQVGPLGTSPVGQPERMRITSDGKVGIGTSAPSHKLDVRDNVNAPVILNVQNLDAGANAYAGLTLSGSGNNFFLRNLSDASPTPNVTEFTSTASGSRFVFSPAGTEGLRITESGYVGVGGVDNPTYPLTVYASKVDLATFRNVGSGIQRGFYISADNNAGTVTLNASGAGAAHMALATGNVEKARLDTAGNFLVGRTANTNTSEGVGLTSSGQIKAAVNQGTSLYINRMGTTGTIADFRYNDALVGSISTNGSSTAYNTSSDYRLKEDLKPLVSPAERLMRLKPVNVSWKSGGSRSDTFIAHELAEVLPYAVTGEKDAVDPDGNPEYQSVDYSKVVPLLTAALQEALTKIENLETRIKEMESEA